MTYQILFLASPLLLAAIAQGLCMKYDWLHPLKRPLDFGLYFREKRLFGDNKTWRGLLINVVLCFAGTMIQAWLQKEGYTPQWLLLLDYRKHGYIVGILLGLGMTVGELPNSFLKRQMEIPPGKKKGGSWGVVFFLFDQVDLTIGIWVFLFFIIRPSFLLILWSFALTFVLHMAVSSVGYLLQMRKTIV
ncbi:MAG: CDP-archaeol synthase [Desulfobacteraceae bacterium]|jgi:hypothetical protein